MPNELSSSFMRDYGTYQCEYWRNTHRIGSTFGTLALWLSTGADLVLHHFVHPLPLLWLFFLRVACSVQMLGLAWFAVRRGPEAQKPIVYFDFVLTGLMVGVLSGTVDSVASPPLYWAACLCVVVVTGSYPNSIGGTLSLSMVTLVSFVFGYLLALPAVGFALVGPLAFVSLVGPAITCVGSLSLDRSLRQEFRARKQLAVTLQDIGDGVIVTNAAGRIVLLNRKAQEITGVGELKATGRALSEVFPWLCEFSDGAHEPVELRLPNPEHETWVSLTVTPLDGAIFSFQDITQRKRYEAETLRSSRMEALKLVAGGIAHDFNNLLMGVTGSASLLMEEPELSTDVKETISSIEEASRQASQLAGRLLTFSKGGSPVKEVHSLEEIIKASASFVLSGSKVKLRTEIPEDLWPCEVDAAQFGRVVQNLTVNAVEAMPSGGEIKIVCRNVGLEGQSKLQAGRYVEVLFRDQGEGIPEEMLGRIFDPYFTTKEAGSGLGLAACYSIVEAHGGTLKVSSEVGRGTEFQMLLPATDAALKPKPKNSSKKLTLTGGRVLILEDEEPVSRVLSRMLERLGLTCEVTAHGEATVEAYRKALEEGFPFRLVILDLTVPGGMGGQEAIKQLRQLDPGVKAIVSSGYSDGDVLAEYRKFGFQARLAKPYGMAQLKETIGEFLGG